MSGSPLLRVVLALSVLAALSFPLVWESAISEAVLIAWKGAGVALLALYAALLARSVDGWLIAIVLALGALGDVLLEASLVWGAIAFMAGHVVAIWLYVRNHRETLSVSQGALALLLVPLAVAIAWMLPDDRAAAGSVALYAFAVSVMAAFAWTSRFPRYRVGLGAMLFVASDILIFARMGRLAESGWVSYAIWYAYYGGQLLICLGVTWTLRRAATEG